jgi:hypothetical protein
MIPRVPVSSWASSRASGQSRALKSFLVGCHHRISHTSLVVWLERNQKFQRDSA